MHPSALQATTTNELGRHAMATTAPPAPKEHRRRALPEMSQTLMVPSAPPVEHQPDSAKATLTTAAPASSSSSYVGACSSLHINFLEEQWTRAAQPSSAPPKTKSGSDGWKAMHDTAPWVMTTASVDAPLCGRNAWAHWPLRGFQTLKDPSAEPETIFLPSHVKPPHKTAPSWPAKTRMQAPDVASHIHKVPSQAPQSTTSPFGCHASHSTSPGPSSVRRSRPDAASHSLTEPS
mmetsp:Transcript_19115/g.54657  ORF Transcript_19115/g.54657 Transcript_19115/m.54657 type:complete len:234 (-) Transcript_19115:573-1274(-)